MLLNCFVFGPDSLSFCRKLPDIRTILPWQTGYQPKNTSQKDLHETGTLVNFTQQIYFHHVLLLWNRAQVNNLPWKNVDLKHFGKTCWIPRIGSTLPDPVTPLVFRTNTWCSQMTWRCYSSTSLKVWWWEEDPLNGWALGLSLPSLCWPLTRSSDWKRPVHTWCECKAKFTSHSRIYQVSTVISHWTFHDWSRLEKFECLFVIVLTSKTLYW